MATRVQVNLGDKTLALLDRYADAMGVTRSALCSVLIGQGLMNYNPALLGSESDVPVQEKVFPSLEEQVNAAALRSGNGERSIFKENDEGR